MPRMVLLTASLLILAQLQIPGCPLDDGSNGPPSGERLEIETLASSSLSARVGDTVTLTATATGPEDGGPVSFAWLQIAGYGVSIQNADQPVASFVAPSLPEDQTLTFLVTTTNELGDAGRAETRTLIRADPQYAVGPHPGAGTGFGSSRPRANAGRNQNVASGAVVTLDGSASSGVGLAYRWLQRAGPSVSLSAPDAVRTTFTAPTVSGNDEVRLEFELQITDNQRRTANARVSVLVTATGTGTLSPRVRVATSLGNFTIELDRQRAPLSVENFLRYVDEGFYTNTIFHRVVRNFVIQGGGFQPGLIERQAGVAIRSEADNGLRNVRGSVGMARLTDPNSATSQWYVNLRDNPSLDQTPTTPGYTVFGQVISGMDVVDRIGRAQTGIVQGRLDVPLEEIIVRSVTRVTD